MENPLKIKVCGMRNPENIREVAKLKPNFMGFIFYPKSKRYVTDEKAIEIVSAVPGNIKKTGVFVNESIKTIIEKISLFKLDYIQLHGGESPEFCAELLNENIKIIKAFGIDENFDFESISPYYSSCDYFLFDTKSEKHGGTGLKFNWEILKKYSNEKPVFLSGGIGPDDAEQIKQLSFLNIYAVDINSKFEKEPALKNILQLEQFINQINNI